MNLSDDATRLCAEITSSLRNSCRSRSLGREIRQANRSAPFSLTSSSYDMSSTLRIHVTLALTSNMFFFTLTRPATARFASTRDAFWLGCTGPNASLKIRVTVCRQTRRRLLEIVRSFSCGIAHSPFATYVQVTLQGDLCYIRHGEHISNEYEVGFSSVFTQARISPS